MFSVAILLSVTAMVSQVQQPVSPGLSNPPAPVSAAGPEAAGDPGPEAAGDAPTVLSGVHESEVYLAGRVVAALDRGAINCLGHAAGVDAAVYVGTGALADALDGLGYKCHAGTSDDLNEAIAAGHRALMVYLDIYPPAWREEAERDLTVDELVQRYGWSENSWREQFVFYDRDGRSRPIDYHALAFNARTRKWDWVAAAHDKDASGTYEVDDTSWHPAAELDPDLYFDPRFVLSSVACEAP